MNRSTRKNVFKLIEAANAKVPDEQLFLLELKRTIEQENEKQARLPSLTYKPSSMKCIRNMYYQRIGAERDPSTSSYCLIGMGNSGTDIHIRIQAYVAQMKENGFDCEYISVSDYVQSRDLTYLDVVAEKGMETKLFHKDLNMSFMCDGIVRYKSKYYILEIKTETGFKWNRREDVDPAHHQQGTAYSVALKIPQVIFLYISRDTSDMKSYLFTPSSAQKNSLVGTITECEDYVKVQKTPPKPDDIDRKTCEYCRYKTQCSKE